MLEFRVKNIVPPGGIYFYEVDEVPLQDYTRSGLLTKIRAAYRAKGEDAPADIWAKVEDFMCRRLPETFCDGTDDGRPRARVLTIKQVQKNTADAIQKYDRCGPAKAKLHAEKCNQCPLNNRSMCPTCSGINRWASMAVGRPDTPASFDYLGVCEADGTALVAKVNLEDVEPNDNLHEDCWILEEAKNGSA